MKAWMARPSRRSARRRDEVGVDGWQGKTVVIVGLARQGKALASHFSQKGARVVVTDLKPESALAEAKDELEGMSVEFALGGHPIEILEGADLVCLSGGVPADIPLVVAARSRGIPLSNDSQVFLEACPAVSIGITGSAGKSTTTALVGRIAAAAFHPQDRRAWVGGNIGRPLLHDLAEMRARDFAVLELSSFQLELMTRSPNVGAVLNIFPDHLDRHTGMRAYAAAKARVLDFQGEDDVAVLNHSDLESWNLRRRVRGRLLSFGHESPPQGYGAFLQGGEIRLAQAGRQTSVCPVGALRLPGEHNALNAAAACAVGLAVGVGAGAMRAAIEAFEGLPHRLEFIRSVGGVDWYNDSIATSPARAMAAMRSFERRLIVLAGGRDKGLPWQGFAQTAAERAEHVVLFGEAAGVIEQALEQRGPRRTFKIHRVDSLDGAVSKAAELATPGDVVLLAPGGTSFDAFVDFEARGERFKELVEGL